MKRSGKVVQVLALVVLFPLMIGTVICAVGYMTYRRNRLACDSPISPNHVRKLGVGLPPGVEICEARGTDEAPNYNLLVSTPNPICSATEGKLACPSMAKLAMHFVLAMKGWDTGQVTSDDDSGRVEFMRGKDRATVRLRRSRYGEVTADLDVQTN